MNTEIIKLIIILLTVQSVSNAQTIPDNDSRLYIKDTCAWDKAIDTIKVKYVLMSGDYGKVFKLSCGYIVESYEKKQCQFMWTRERRNIKVLIDGKNRLHDIIMYKREDGTICFY